MPSQDDGEPSEAEQAQNLLDPILESLKTRFGQRWASVWLEWEPRHLVNIGVVEPTRGEIVDLAAQAQAVGWVARVVAVRYSERDLRAFHEHVLDVIQRYGRGMVPLSGPDVRLNKVQVVLSGRDDELVDDLIAAIPADALVISVQPGIRVRPLAQVD